MELAADQPHRFGGLGLMIEAPQLRLRVSRASPSSSVSVSASTSTSTSTSAADQSEIERRVRLALEQVQKHQSRHLPENWAVNVVEHPPLHSGLGLGTQLAAAVATAVELATTAAKTATGIETETGVETETAIETETGIETEPSTDASAGWCPVTQTPLVGQPAARPCQGQERGEYQRQERVRELAHLSGRGKRSAIGLHGFLYGGLVQDLGYTLPRVLSTGGSRASQPRPIATGSVAFPDSWSIVLILSTQTGEVHGAAEERLIAAAGAEPNRRRQTMLELSEACLTAAAASDFGGFVAALEAYMPIAASLFEPVQAGRYRDAIIAQRVDLAAGAGLRGVGQSSWGPTVFGFVERHSEAQTAADRLQCELGHGGARVLVTRAANQGARWRRTNSGVQHAG